MKSSTKDLQSRTKKPAIRKPKDQYNTNWSNYIEGGEIVVDLYWLALKPKQARKLAKWLLSAADYIENTNRKGR
jgi:hypothetical protein